MLETIGDEIISIEQKVTYIEVDGKERVYNAKGDADTIWITMPDTERIDVNYAKDSIEGLNYSKVILVVESNDGNLFVPEESIPLVAEYGYCLSVTNGRMTVVLDKAVVNSLSGLEGDWELSIHQARPAELTEAQKETIGEFYAISLSLTIDRKYISELGGTASVDVKSNRDDVTVYYVDLEGNKELIDSQYLDGQEHFEVDHFSVYMFEYPVEPDDPSEPTVIFAITIVFMFLPIGALVAWEKRKKDD
ncbi:MAG: hypothetical protein E7Z65_08050 [Thermoplasmata archaeon]|jgi:hypothetical protein|nr:hypothetical protein [Thermoplasmata archaeon]